MNDTDNLTEMLSLVGETEAWTLTLTESCWTSQEAVSREELCTGEGLEARVNQQVSCLTLGTQLHHIAQGMPLVPCRRSETVTLLPGVCSLQIREKGQETEDNRL